METKNTSPLIAPTEEIKANQFIYNEYFDPDFIRDLVEHVMAHIDRCYFRSQFIGFDKLPKRNNPHHPLIYASNHSGMAFPWDGIIFGTGLVKNKNFDFSQSLRALTAPALSQTRLMNPYLVDNIWKKAGGIDATFLNLETMMYYQDSDILIYPEGVPGIGKGFNKKYQLQRFSSSFVRMSVKYKTDIVSFSTLNGEYINPYNLESKFVNKLSQKIGIPYIPVGLMTLLVPLQPWLFYFGFPAKLTYVMGRRIKPYEWVDKPYEDISYEEFRVLTDRVRALMQEDLTTAVKEYGQKPYQAKELFSTWKRNRKYFPFFLPFFWPSIFREFHRLSQKGRVNALKMNFWHGLKAFRKNPITIAFFLPIIGWIPILWLGYQQGKKR